MQTTDNGGNSYGTSSKGVSSQVHKPFITSKLKLNHAGIVFFYFLRNNLNCLNLLAVWFTEPSTPSKKLPRNVITFFAKVDLLCN